MPNRYVRNTAILAKIETTYGTDAAPLAATDALLISNASIDINPTNQARDILRPFMGASEQLVGTRSVQIAFEVEVSGSGTAGTAPAWGKLLLASGMSEVVTATTRVDYTPVSNTFGSLTIYYHMDGVQYKALGCRGTFELMMGIGDIPKFMFTFTGLDGGVAAIGNPNAVLTAWKAPLVITDPNTGDVKLGGVYSAGAITGGTSFPSRGLSLNIANNVVYQPMLGGESVLVTNRESTGSLTLDLLAAQEVTMRTEINANTLTSMSLEHGTIAGGKIIIFAPAVQRLNPKNTEQDGMAMLGMDLRLTPTTTGNDELRIVSM
jgi:hypothetical protein